MHCYLARNAELMPNKDTLGCPLDSTRLEKEYSELRYQIHSPRCFLPLIFVGTSQEASKNFQGGCGPEYQRIRHQAEIYAPLLLMQARGGVAKLRLCNCKASASHPQRKRLLYHDPNRPHLQLSAPSYEGFVMLFEGRSQPSHHPTFDRTKERNSGFRPLPSASKIPYNTKSSSIFARVTILSIAGTTKQKPRQSNEW